VRYIDSLNLNSNIECFILIEPGLGYLINVLQERFKSSKIIALHVEQQQYTPCVPALYSIKQPDIQNFLEAQLPKTDSSKIKVIEWRPSLNYYKDAYAKLLSHVVDFLKRTNAETRTTAAFGRRWVKNFFKNLKNINNTLLYKQVNLPVIIAGSGPSLENALPVIKEAQHYCLVIAASSSVMALSNSGISIDIIVATDGGNWALHHLYSGCRNSAVNSLAVSLNAALPSQCANMPKLIINDGSFWQSIILHELSLPSVIIPQRGTVTATAVELALLLSSNNIYLAGMDFSNIDIRTHVRPYNFDNLFYSKANRFLPFYYNSYIRSSLIRQGGSLDIYAAWFKSQLDLWPKRIFSIIENKIFTNGIPLEQPGLNKKCDFFKSNNVKMDADNLKQQGVSALLNAMKNSEYSQDIKKELSLLLFSKDDIKNEQELELLLKELAFNG